MKKEEIERNKVLDEVYNLFLKHSLYFSEEFIDEFQALRPNNILYGLEKHRAKTNKTK